MARRMTEGERLLRQFPPRVANLLAYTAVLNEVMSVALEIGSMLVRETCQHDWGWYPQTMLEQVIATI